MDDISGDMLFSGLIGYGLFPDKIPPMFTSLPWLDFFTQNTSETYSKEPTQYIFYESMRNTNVPRMMGIPNPISYTLLCQHIKNYWPNIRSFFKEQTKDQSYKKSRIHIRKKKNDKVLFHMNYGNSDSDGPPELDLLFDAYYVVKADISQCFPSMYSHAISWALVGKEKAKADKAKDDFWYNLLDRRTRNIKDGETNGFLIGPHASNLLSEIILCAIDSKLAKWNYFRNIDDFTCYVKNQQEAEAFLVDLSMELKEFGLNLNHKKTEIIKLPIGQEESWVRKLNNNFALYSNARISYRQIHAFMEFVIDLVKETGNSAVINYAMKMIARRNLDEKARQYYITMVLHLSLIYTYLFPFLDEYLFIPFDVIGSKIQSLSELMYTNGCAAKNAESISYALYFAIKYQFEIPSYNSSDIFKIPDCILHITAWRYAKTNKLDLNPFYTLAKEQSQLDYDFNRNWLFVYEVLKQSDLENTWASMKGQKVSFLTPLKDVFAKMSPDYELMDLNPYFICDYDSCNKFIDEVWNNYVADHPNDSSDRDKQFLKIIILNLRVAFVNRKNVIIPKTLNYYLGRFESHGKEIFTTCKHIVPWLKDNCYVGERLGDPDYGYSSYWAKQKLYSCFPEIPTGMLTTSQKYTSNVIIKNCEKQVVDIPFSEKASLYLSTLDSVNTFYSEQTFSYFPSAQNEERLFPNLTAIFNDSSWEHGGRLYSVNNRGINYQSIPSDLRETIRINGEETVEIDYSGLHISMLYAKKGIQPPEDPYSFLDGEMRQLAKFATLVMINASSETGIIASLEKRKEELHNKQGLSQKKNTLKRALDACTDFSEIVELIKNNHKAISDYFFSGIGIELQNIDSCMALEIIDSFYKKGIPVLPMHDSFIINKKHSSDLKNTMKEIFKKYNDGFECRVK